MCITIINGGVCMFYLLGEPGYNTSNWYRDIVDGIVSEKRTKRFNIVMIDYIEELDNFSINSEDAIFLVGTNLAWLGTTIDICEQKFDKNVIVLGCFEHYLKGKSYSVISSDILAGVCDLYSYLESYNKFKIALYGVNPNSASDNYRKSSYISYGGTQEDVFYNNADLKSCYQSFKDKASNYDAVICVNDYSAISLIRNLKDSNIEIPFVVSCGETKLSRTFKPGITNLKISYRDFGKAAIDVYKILQKDFPTSCVKVKLSPNIIPGESTDNLPVKLNPREDLALVETLYSEDPFYLDNEVDEMLKIEKILNSSDSTEFDMLYSLMVEGMTYIDVADKFHISVNGIKYKVKKLFENSGINSRDEFIKLVKKYII